MVAIRCREVKFSNLVAVLFDKDGTLEDSQSFLRELAQKRSRLIDAQIPGIGEPLLMAFGVQDATLDPTGLMAVGSRRENEIAAAAYIAETGRSWLESLSIARSAFADADRYLTQAAQTSPLFTGSLEVLKFLAETGLKLGILSADSTPGVEAFITRHQLSDYIQLGMGVDDSGLTKPDPQLFLQACQALGVEPGQTLMIGDSAGDIQMATEAGAAGTVGICWGTPQAAHLEKADVAIASLDELEIVPE
ncbi:HAD family hydrolase [Oscillatoria salina]|uniref:HAD family hydrolase n=1 Tax=Oscillatoria salina TaxID=331517 RepID=UPI0013BB1CB7|nr:HAD family hydrolase [Oscillatoria salina]MBZ8179411.1 HAD family hydrolase [Oscillatoria salina IIICB1]NET87850.1 HAD family hydrolase [Kamptonema sp. SIO1D9]